MHTGEQAVQHVERPRLGAAKRGGVGGERPVGTGERGLAQEEGRREPLDRAAHDAGGVLGLDLALDHDAELRDRAGRGERMGDVAERVLAGLEPAIRRDVDPPVHHVLAVVVARRQAQRLDHARDGRLVAVDRLVRDRMRMASPRIRGERGSAVTCSLHQILLADGGAERGCCRR